jgi:hypothetical protein
MNVRRMLTEWLVGLELFDALIERAAQSGDSTELRGIRIRLAESMDLSNETPQQSAGRYSVGAVAVDYDCATAKRLVAS